MHKYIRYIYTYTHVKTYIHCIRGYKPQYCKKMLEQYILYYDFQAYRYIHVQ